MEQAKRHSILNNRPYRHKTQKKRTATLIHNPTDPPKDLPQFADDGDYVEHPSAPPKRVILVINPKYDDITCNLGNVSEEYKDRRIGDWLDATYPDPVPAAELAAHIEQMDHGFDLLPFVEEPHEEWIWSEGPNLRRDKKMCDRDDERTFRGTPTFRPMNATRIPRPCRVIPPAIRRLVDKLLHPPSWAQDHEGRARRDWLATVSPSHFDLNGILRADSVLRVYGRRVLGVDLEVARWWCGVEDKSNGWPEVGWRSLLREVGLRLGERW